MNKKKGRWLIAAASLLVIAAALYFVPEAAKDISEDPSQNSVEAASTENKVTEIPVDEVIRILKGLGYDTDSFELLSEGLIPEGKTESEPCSFELEPGVPKGRDWAWGYFKYDRAGVTLIVRSFNENGEEEDVVIYPENASEPGKVRQGSSSDIYDGAKVIADGKSGNAYDYIISVMSEPQYWSEEEYFPPYSASYLEEEARETLVNGTGWTLSDESTASFKRGYKTTLTISFANHTAVSEDPVSGITYFLDYKNEKYYYEMNGVKTSLTLHRDTDGYWNTSFGMLEETFYYYESLFEAAGCPLLEKPAGTLSEYRNSKAEEASLIDDGLIHAVWKQEGFSFDWMNAEGIEWLSDYKEAFDKKVPKSELRDYTIELLDGSITRYRVGLNSPLYLVLADKKSSDEYLLQDGSSWFESIYSFDNVAESFAAYFLAPAMKAVYGYNAVWFTDCRNLKGPNQAECLISRKNFDEGFSFDYDSYSQIILELYPEGDEDAAVGPSYTADMAFSGFKSLIETVRGLYDHYGVSWPYGDDYLGNFLLVYSLDTQRFLGLR